MVAIGEPSPAGGVVHTRRGLEGRGGRGGPAPPCAEREPPDPAGLFSEGAGVTQLHVEGSLTIPTSGIKGGVSDQHMGILLRQCHIFDARLTRKLIMKY